MKTEYLKKIKELPEFVQEALGGETYKTNSKIREECNLDSDKMSILSDIKAEVLLKNFKIEQLFTVIKEALKLNDKIAKEITLIILCEILYPIKDYFPGIKDEILKLGGEVPKTRPKRMNAQLLNRTEEMEAMQEKKEREEKARMADTIIKKTIENLIKKYPKVGKQSIGNQKAIKIKDMSLPMKPLIKYWLRDYQEKMDYVWHSNIDRAHYVYQDKNTKNMNEEERRQLNLVLKSLDEKILLPYSTRLKKIDFSKIGEE
ncbi:MAG: hypothetical protein U9N04_01075 [Patescibacteria group bacterium]|nr:hypothetical protein [Patescibacteria group bacterium]